MNTLHTRLDIRRAQQVPEVRNKARVLTMSMSWDSRMPILTISLSELLLTGRISLL